MSSGNAVESLVHVDAGHAEGTLASPDVVEDGRKEDDILRAAVRGDEGSLLEVQWHRLHQSPGQDAMIETEHNT